MITNKYKYPELKRVENTLGRFYIDPEKNGPLHWDAKPVVAP